MEHEKLEKSIQNKLNEQLRIVVCDDLNYDEMKILVCFIERICFGLKDSFSENNMEANKILKEIWNAFDEVYNDLLDQMEY